MISALAFGGDIVRVSPTASEPQTELIQAS